MKELWQLKKVDILTLSEYMKLKAKLIEILLMKEIEDNPKSKPDDKAPELWVDHLYNVIEICRHVLNTEKLDKKVLLEYKDYCLYYAIIPVLKLFLGGLSCELFYGFF